MAFVLILLTAGAALVNSARPHVEDWLVAKSGETETRLQIVNLISYLQPPVLDEAPEAAVDSDTMPFGMNTFLEQEVEDWKLRRTFELLKAANVRWIRQQIPWSDIEVNAKGDYTTEYGSTWAKYDKIVALANEYNIHILARLDSPPAWSRTDNRVHNRPPDNYEDYGDFVYNFVSRYKGKITYFQIWNEPNIFPEWGWQEANAAEYVKLLKVAYTRAKEANPNAVIVMAALAPTLGTPDGYNESDLVYLQQIYDNGGAPYFDIMAAMGYSLWTGPLDRRADTGRVNLSRVLLIRDVMVRNGDANKPVWVSELGWDALPIDAPIEPTHGQVSREIQARYLSEAYKRAQQEWPWLGVMFTWHLRMVHDENRDQPLYYFGLADADFTLHPAYYAYQELASKPATIYPGRKSESFPSISFTGNWSYTKEAGSDGPFLRTRTPGEALAFRFKGAEVALLLHRGPAMGRAKVLIDGVPADSLPDGVLDLSTPDERWQEPVVVAAGLPDTEHRLDLLVQEGQVDFDGVIVRAAPSPLGEYVVIGAIAFMMLIGGAWSLAGWAVTSGVPQLARLPWPTPSGARRRSAAVGGWFARRLPRRQWVSVRLPKELYDELARELPAERRRPFIVAAVMDALLRRRADAATPPKQSETGGESAVPAGQREGR